MADGPGEGSIHIRYPLDEMEHRTQQTARETVASKQSNRRGTRDVSFRMRGRHRPGCNLLGVVDHGPGEPMSKASRFRTNPHRPQTEKKLRILRKYMGPWLDIWSKTAKSSEWFVVDVFAGSGTSGGHFGPISGSPLVILEEVERRRAKLASGHRHINVVLIEKDAALADELTARTTAFIDEHGLRDLVSVSIHRGDCNDVLPVLLPTLASTDGAPALLFVDPCNTDISRATFETLLDMPWREDVLFNYMVSAVKRDVGCMIAAKRGSEAASERLGRFFGPDDVPVSQDQAENPGTLGGPLFCSRGHKVVVFYMEYPSRHEIQYQLMFASKNDTVSKKIVPEIFAKEYTDRYGQPTIFGADEFLVEMKILERM